MREFFGLLTLKANDAAGSAAAAHTEPTETFFVDKAPAAKVASAEKNTAGLIISATPALTATPLPPLKL